MQMSGIGVRSRHRVRDQSAFDVAEQIEDGPSVHQYCNERQVAAESIQRGNEQLRLVPPAGAKRLFQLGPAVALAALDLGELVEQRPLAAFEIIDDGLALSFEAEAGSARDYAPAL